MKVELLGNRILVKKLKESENDIIIPDALKAELPYGEIVATGPGYLKENSDNEWTPLDMKIGDKVIFHPRAGVEISLNNVEYKILLDREILAIVNSEKGYKLPEEEKIADINNEAIN